MKETSKTTTEDIHDALMARYTEPEWYLGFEVANSCGSEVVRHADAVAICPYPSRAFETVGFEIKVSRSDLMRELKDPKKCETMYQFVNEWFLVVPKGLTKGLNIPIRWGILEYVDGKLRQKRRAAWHEAKLTKGFMMAFIKGRQRMDALEAKRTYEFHQKMLRNEIEGGLPWWIQDDLKRLKELTAELDTLEKETGIRLTGKNTPEVLATLKTAQQMTKLLKSGTSQSVIQDVDKAMDLLTESTAKIKKAYALFGALTDPGKGT